MLFRSEVFLVSLSLLLLLKGRYILLGLTLGALFLAWTGAGYIILVLTAAVLVRLYQLYLRREDVTTLSTRFPISVLIAGGTFLLVSQYSVAQTENFLSLFIGAGMPLLFYALYKVTEGDRKAFIVTSVTDRKSVV